jgi:AcrR family transcriptional regulator
MTKITTRQRLLDKSSELFNSYGIEAVSIGHISDALQISTGNLTYHFKKIRSGDGTHRRTGAATAD